MQIAFGFEDTAENYLMKLKKKLVILALCLFLLSFVPLVMAQVPMPSVDALHVSFWPDYDEPAVLVLITGSLPADTRFPAQLTIPVPENADINAVARMSSEVGMADIEYQVDGDRLTLTTPDPQFRVEYYVPYTDDGDWRSYDFVWDSELEIQEFTAEIQQPSSAVSLVTEPPAENSITNPSDGLIYHGMPTQTVLAGTPYELSFRYNATDSGLTAGGQRPVQEDLVVPPVGSNSQSTGINWLYVLVGVGLLLLVAIITWLVATRYSGKKNNRKPRKSQKPRKPAPRAQTNKQVRFCHGCGSQAEADDRFCRTCGTELK